MFGDKPEKNTPYGSSPAKRSGAGEGDRRRRWRGRVRAPILTLKRARKLWRRMTLPEVLLWEKLRGGRLNNLRFRRQHPVGPYILDFYSSLARLALEIDGVGHEHPERRAHDKRRDSWLAENDIRIMRISAADI